MAQTVKTTAIKSVLRLIIFFFSRLAVGGRKRGQRRDHEAGIAVYAMAALPAKVSGPGDWPQHSLAVSRFARRECTSQPVGSDGAPGCAGRIPGPALRSACANFQKLTATPVRRRHSGSGCMPFRSLMIGTPTET